jgi:dethiobiotin synthetase
MASGYYITGTDTSVGKTLVSVALLHAFRAGGRTAIGMKPVASGCVATDDGWRNDDALALQSASAPLPPYELVNPFALPAATAPQIAAALAGIRVRLPPILSAYHALEKTADSIVIEGVGGWRAPLADDLEQAQLVDELDLQVILVVGIKLGCLNHARLSEQSILDGGFRLVGWIGTFVESALDFGDEYAALLKRTLRSPCLGIIAHEPHGSPASLAAYLRLPKSA